MKMYDLRRASGYWHFRFAGGEDFWDTLKELKRRVPPEERNWNAEEREWSVKGTDHNEDVLMDIFKNGKSCLTMVKSQLQLF